MWNTVKIHWRCGNSINTLEEIGKMIFESLKTYDVNDRLLSKAKIKRIKKAKKEDCFENAIYELIKSGNISKKTFKRFLSQTYIDDIGMYEYYINYSCYDTIIERMLDYVQIINRGIINNNLSVTNNFIPKQKSALNDIQFLRNEYQFYCKYYTDKLCELNGSLNELDIRRSI